MDRYGGLDNSVFDLNTSPPIINRVFDTWHPEFNFTNDQRPDLTGVVPMPENDSPPFRPLWSDRDNFTTVSLGPRPTYWMPDTDYAVGDRVFPQPIVTVDSGGNRVTLPGHRSFFYQATPVGNASPPLTTGLIEPIWPQSSAGTVQDGEIIWLAVPNTIGIHSLQITVRFYDPTSGQMRQFTLMHPFVEQ